MGATAQLPRLRISRVGVGRRSKVPHIRMRICRGWLRHVSVLASKNADRMYKYSVQEECILLQAQSPKQETPAPEASRTSVSPFPRASPLAEDDVVEYELSLKLLRAFQETPGGGRLRGLHAAAHR